MANNYTIAESVDEIRKKTLYCRQIRLSEKQNHIAEVLCSSNVGKKHTVRSLLVWGGLPHILADFRRVILHSSFLAYKGKAILFRKPSSAARSVPSRYTCTAYPHSLLKRKMLRCIVRLLWMIQLVSSETMMRRMYCLSAMARRSASLML